MRERRVGPLRALYAFCAPASTSASTRSSSAALPAHPTPVPTHHRRPYPPDRYYVGRRCKTEVRVVGRAEVEPLPHLKYRSGAEFDWGLCNVGALELAFALLADATESHPADVVCRAFCTEVIACLDPAGFVLSHGDVAIWLMTVAENDESWLSDRGADGHKQLGARAIRRIRSWLGRG